MSRFKLFVENFVVYGLGSMISKFIPLLMLPIITRLMPDSYYFGLNDISTVVVNFGTAIAIMGLYDAMYRLFFEKSNKLYRQEVCSTALIFTLMMSLFVFVILILFRNFFSVIFFSDVKYANLLFLTAISILIGSTNSIIAAPTRMQNKKRIYIFFNTVSPLISYGISIPLLLNGYYIIALPLASIVAAFTIEISFYIINRKWFSFKNVKLKHLKELLKIGVPLMPNFLIYWIFNSSDKLMIAKILGNSYTGIYAVGGKIGHISQLIYTAFSGGWQFFSFSTMNDEDQVEMTSNIFEYLGIISFIACMILCSLNEFIFCLFFTGDYLDGAIVVPYLFMAPLIQMLYQVACNQFIIIKKTWPTMFILSIGAIINIVLNYFGIFFIGIEGAALATLIGYIVSAIICVLVLIHMDLFIVRKRFIISMFLFITFFIIWRFILKGYILPNIILGLVICGIYFFLYKNDLNKLIKK